MQSPDYPDPPDPQETAAAQTGSNVSNAIANMLVQMQPRRSPTGNIDYSYVMTDGSTMPITQAGALSSQPGYFGGTYGSPPAGTGAPVAGQPVDLSDATAGQGYYVPDQQGQTPIAINQPTGQTGLLTADPVTHAGQAGQAPIAATGGPLGGQGSGGSGVQGGPFTTNQGVTPVSQNGQPLAPGAQGPTAVQQGPSQAFHAFYDPSTGETYQIPIIEETVSLTPEAQGIFDANQAAQQNLADAARDQSAFLGEYLGDRLDLDAITPARAEAPEFGQLDGSAIAPTEYQTDVRRGNVQFGIDDPGAITQSYGANDFSADRRRYEDAIMSRLNPQIEQDRERLEQTLINRGINIGSQAYHDAMGDYDRQTNDARTSAILAGGQEQSRMVGLDRDQAAFQNAAQQQGYAQQMGQAGLQNQAVAQRFGQDMAYNNAMNQLQDQRFGQDLTNRELQNAAVQGQFSGELAEMNANNANRQAAINEAFAQRNQPLNEIGALLSGSQVQMPNLPMMQAPGIAGTDYAGIVSDNYNQRLAAANARNSAQQSLYGNLIGAGGALLGGFM